MQETGPAPPDPGTADTDGTAAVPRIPGYTLRKPLGRGGMATVFLATQESLDRPVAIKVMEREALRDEVSRQRFENEARTIARLAHPGIVGIHEVGRTDDGRMFYVMAYLPRGDLSRRDLRNDEARIAQVLDALLATLGHAHARGIVHRDVKRENVLFDADDRPLLADFGIATSRGDASRLTSEGTALGSSGYMAPEQARGAVVDGRADLYGVGVLAYELLTGQLPFQADDGLALALKHAQDPVPRLPPERQHWQAFIDRAMAKSPGERFADAQQMRAALDGVVAGRGVAAVGEHRRAPLLLAGAALLLLLVIGFAVRTLTAKSDFVTAAAPASNPSLAGGASAPMLSPTLPPAADSDPRPVGGASAPTPSATSPPPATAPPPAHAPAQKPHPTLATRARNAKDKVKRWFRKH